VTPASLVSAALLPCRRRRVQARSPGVRDLARAVARGPDRRACRDRDRPVPSRPAGRAPAAGPIRRRFLEPESLDALHRPLGRPRSAGVAVPAALPRVLRAATAPGLAPPRHVA